MINEQNFNQEQVRIRQFEQLRERIHKQLEEETAKRIAENPKPTEEEIYLGAFKEMIEPQVREAVFALLKKGYTPESSGFYGDHNDMQGIDGFFEIDDETKRKLEARGVEVIEEKDKSLHGVYTYIKFKAKEPDIKKMAQTWNNIIELILAKDEIGPPSAYGDLEDFLKKYTPERTDVEKATLERRLRLHDIEPTIEKEMRERVEQIESEGKA